MKFHVVCGFFDIYAGVLNEDQDGWISKSKVTDEAKMAVAQYLIEHSESMDFEYLGDRYKLEVRKL